MNRMIFGLVLLVGLILAVALIVSGCAQSARKTEAVTKSPSPATQPEVVTRVYDIRDLVGNVPEFDTAPDFNLQSKSAASATTRPPRDNIFGGGGSGGGGPLAGPTDSNDSILLPSDDQTCGPSTANIITGRDSGGVVTIQPGKDEVWVIEKRKLDSAARPSTSPYGGEAFFKSIQRESPAADEPPGTGALLCKLPDKQVPIPLKHTDVKASVAGYIATVDVTQQYHNPYDSKIEAVYVFPLPENAAVSDFLMTIGDRHIRGIIRERAEAKRIYEAAKSQGYVASLLTQERPNIFTQSVANIEPGKEISVNIKYFNSLQYVDGWYEFVFPMVVGPRFNPPGTSDGIGAVGRGDRGVSAQKTEIQYLKPGERSGHDISLAVDIDAGVKIEQIDSRNHKVKIDQPEAGLMKIALDSSDAIPNKDFVLRYKVAGDRVKSGLMVQRDAKGNGGYFTLMVYPPESLKDIPRKPLEMFFTLDVSGSMTGAPIEQSRAAIQYALKHMDRNDTFQIIRFASNAEQLFKTPEPATSENIRTGLKYIDAMEAGGGTMMIEGIKRSLQYTTDENRLRFVTFLTDGYIGNEVDILREIHDTRGPTRIFSFGVGSSPNRFLLDNAARIGGGCVAYLGLNDNADAIMAAHFERISHPALTDINVEWNGLAVDEVYPQKMPDLFVGRPVILTGHFKKAGEAGTVKVSGRVGGEVRSMEIPLNIEQGGNHKGISQVWARSKIDEMTDRGIWHADPDLPNQVRTVALEHNLMCAYTAFVAVDSSLHTTGETGTTVAVPVPVPDGVKYETTVQER